MFGTFLKGTSAVPTRWTGTSPDTRRHTVIHTRTELTTLQFPKSGPSGPCGLSYCCPIISLVYGAALLQSREFLFVKLQRNPQTTPWKPTYTWIFSHVVDGLRSKYWHIIKTHIGLPSTGWNPAIATEFGYWLICRQVMYMEATFITNHTVLKSFFSLCIWGWNWKRCY